MRVRVCLGGALLALLGCGRSAVVVAPESSTLADEPARAVARGRDGEGDGAVFPFPEDAGGVLLARVLPPRDTEATRLERPEPPPRSPATAPFQLPPLPLPPSPAIMPRLPAPAPPTLLRPRLVDDETLGGLLDSPVLPESPVLPAGGRVRVTSTDVNEPLRLPVSAQPVTDRASLEDPTMEDSTAAALAATIPPRAQKAPFLKQTLPDPYDNRRGDTPSPAEQSGFPIGSPQPPRK